MSTGSVGVVPPSRAAAPLFAALGDETRLDLLLRLSATGPESIARLSDRAEVSRQAIAKHLGVLERAGLVRGTRKGREHFFELAPAGLHQAHAHLAAIEKQWEEAIERLRAFVED
jgi:DNA-binding transcriptional ArsR family regulator